MQGPSTQPSAETEELIACLLSRVLSTTHAQFPQTHAFCTLLGIYATADAVTPSGAVAPALRREPARDSWPTSETGAFRLGMKSCLDLHDRYQLLRRRRGVRARHDRDVLLRFFPEELWPGVEGLIRDGPALAAPRATEALHLVAERGVSGNRRRDAGAPAMSTMRSYRAAAHSAFRYLDEMRREGFPSRLLAPWNIVPRLPLPDVPTGGYNVCAPPARLVRAKWEELDQDIRARLKLPAGATAADERAAIETASGTAMMGLWKPMRRRVALGLYVVLGGRASTMQRLERSDFVPEFLFFDGTLGPALRVKPMKMAGRWLERYKPLPRELADVIESYLVFVDRYLAFAQSHSAYKSRETSPAEPPLPRTAPLIPSTSACLTAYSGDVLFSGRLGHDKSKALVPRAGPLPHSVPEHHRAFIGYTKHEFRHLAYQLAERAGEIWNEDHPATGGEAQAAPRLYAHALLDHGTSNDLQRIYGDHNSEAQLQRLAGRAMHGIWRLLATDVGAYKYPDLPVYRDALGQLRAVEHELDLLGRKSTRLRETVVGREIPDARLDADASVQEKLDLVIAQNQRLLEQNEELRTLNLDGHAITHRALQLAEQRTALVKRLDLLRFDHRTWVRIPDNVSEPPRDIDWEALEQGEIGAPLLPGARPKPVRDWLTLTEFRRAGDINGRSTLAAWINGKTLPASAVARPWQRDEAVPIDESLGRKFRRIWIPAIPEGFWRTTLMRETLDELLGRWPATPGWLLDGEPGPRCRAPLVLPEPLASWYREVT